MIKRIVLVRGRVEHEEGTGAYWIVDDDGYGTFPDEVLSFYGLKNYNGKKVKVVLEVEEVQALKKKRN
ncbi:MAG: hypothetical protein ACTSPI_00895 [Candidatus Heimdallarchaeaceae archaeon]